MEEKTTLLESLFEKKEVYSKRHEKLWENLYNKYAMLMYGIIYNLTDDRKIVEEIFKDAFSHLKENQIPSKPGYTLCTYVLRHTHGCALQHLLRHEIQPKVTNPPEASKLIHLLCTDCNVSHKVASILNITIHDLKEKLRSTYLELEHYYKEKQRQTEQEK